MNPISKRHVYTILSSSAVLSLMPMFNFQAHAESTPVTAMDTVVVTGTRTERRIAETPVRTEVVSSDLINSLQARSLADTVEYTTGVRVESNCQNCNFSQIRLNGLEGSFTQILFDSQQTVSSLAAAYGVEQIPAAMIKQIEIVKGGASALYGPGAIGGVVNIIPHEPTRNETQVNYRYEIMDSDAHNHVTDFTTSFVSKDKKTNGFIFGQYEDNDELDLSGDGFTEISRRENASAGIRLNHYVDSLDGGKLSFDYNIITENRRGGDQVDKTPVLTQLAEDTFLKRHAVMLGWDQTVSPDLDYRITGSYALTERDSYYGGGGDPSAFGFTKNPLYNLDTQVNHYFEAAGEHTLSWGVQHNRSEIEDVQLGYNRIIDDAFYYTGGYMQDDWQITPNINLITGIRADKHSEVSDVIASPRVAVMYNPVNNVRIRGSVSTGFRAPQVFDEDLHIALVGGEGVVVRNDPDLKEEKSVSYQVGAEYTPTVGKGVALFEANLFRTDIRDTFFNDETDDPATTNQLEFTKINRGRSSVYGAEINLGYQIAEKAAVELGYVEQRARFDKPDDDFNTREYFRTPDRYAAATMSYKDPDIADFFVGVRYTGPMKVPNRSSFLTEDRLETSEDFLTFDVSVQKEIDLGKGHKPVVTIGGRNITNDRQQVFDSGPDRDSDYVYGPRFPGSVYAGISYKF